jgi:hypothetical protein
LNPTEHPKYRVHVIDEATVVDRGERVRVWFLPYNDSWVRAKDHPQAGLEEVNSEDRHPHCPPGTIWKREVEMLLPFGTPLLSRVTTPLIESLEPMEYLMRNKHTMRRHIEETWFVVVGNYRLKKSKEPEEFSLARKAHHDAGESR